MMQENYSGFLEMRRLAAMTLLRIAIVFVTREKNQWKSGPPRSRDGEHLRGDTWHARDNLVYSPTDPDEIAAKGEVKIGYRKSAWYAAWWEIKGRRKGLLEMLRKMQVSGAMSKATGSYGV